MVYPRIPYGRRNTFTNGNTTNAWKNNKKAICGDFATNMYFNDIHYLDLFWNYTIVWIYILQCNRHV